MEMISRARGVLYGQCIGDNLGALVEFYGPEEVAAEYPDGVREMHDGGYWGLKAGQPTDDTEMAIELIDALRRAGGFDESEALAGYQRWMATDPFDAGNTCRSALERGEKDHGSQANGALMRISPLAVAYAGKPEEAERFARADAELTHPNPMTVAANAVYAGALADVLGGADPQQALRTRLERENLDQYRDDRAIARGDTTATWETQLPNNGGGWVCTALNAVVYHVAQGTDFEEALVQTIALGGDTDTNAAIVGAFLGGVVGEQAIPQRWRDIIDAIEPPLAHNRPERYVPRPREWAAALLAE